MLTIAAQLSKIKSPLLLKNKFIYFLRLDQDFYRSNMCDMKLKLRITLLGIVTILTLGALWLVPGGDDAHQPGEAIAAETEGGAGEQAELSEPWNVRCQEEPKYCEIVQRLIMKESGQRFAEIAVGYPPSEKTARGVMILPLGVLLEEGVKMQIDEGQAYKFNFRYCSAQGCFAVVTLNEALISKLKKGNQAMISFKNLKGQNINLPITLKGFTSAIEQIG